MNTVIFFRGRNTAAIIEDARKFGILSADEKIIVICRPNDSMAEPGDVEGLGYSLPSGDITIVANGGTTSQVVPVVARITAAAKAEDTAGHCNCRWQQDTTYDRDWKWRAIDLQRDGVTHLAGDKF